MQMVLQTNGLTNKGKMKCYLISLKLYYFIYRFHRKNRLFGGLWFGKKKPHFQTFMQPFATSLRDLFHKGG